MTKYMQVNFSDAVLYEYSKEEKEGFVEHKNQKGELAGYRKYNKDGVTGELICVKERLNDNYNDKAVKELVITIKDGEDYVNINFNTYNARKSFSSFAEDIIKALPSLKIGSTYLVRPYNFIPKDSKNNRPIVGVSFKEGGSKGEKVEKLRQSYMTKEGERTEGVIPPVTWSVVRGESTPNEEEKTNYLYDVYTKALETLDTSDASHVAEPSAPKEDKKPDAIKEAGKKAVKAKVEDDDEQELPF